MHPSAKIWLPALLAALLVAGACDPPRSAAPVESPSRAEHDAAHALAAQITAIATAPTSANALLDALDPAPLLTLLAPAGFPAPEPFGIHGSAPTVNAALTDCLLATDSAATLSECELGEHVIDGTWSLRQNGTHTELTDVFVLGPGQHGSLWLDARLYGADAALSAPASIESIHGTIDGTIELSLMWTVDGKDHTLDVSIDVEGLLPPPYGTPTGAHTAPSCVFGGALTISDGAGQSDNRQTTLWFGPGCGDVQISRGL
ncbi:hypothetical protein [Haliangium sp.]|uniref:hypothetical protein n=1 Tax=Haliangium sp. TaxID=2663208 RepID=UPI003D0FDCAF